MIDLLRKHSNNGQEINRKYVPKERCVLFWLQKVSFGLDYLDSILDSKKTSSVEAISYKKKGEDKNLAREGDSKPQDSAITGAG